MASTESENVSQKEVVNVEDKADKDLSKLEVQHVLNKNVADQFTVEDLPAYLRNIFESDDGNVDMQQFLTLLWKNRDKESFISEFCHRLSLAHIIIHFGAHLMPKLSETMEEFMLLLCQSSVHFALQFFWIIYATLDENRPKQNGNPKTFARCAQLLLALEKCLVYGSPAAGEALHLLTRDSISQEEMEKILIADRRFFAAQINTSHCIHDEDIAEGWLFKKGGGTRKVGRRNWNLRWCRIEQRILVIYTKPGAMQAKTAISLDRAEIRLIDKAKHPFYFEIAHGLSETIFQFAAKNKEDMLWWMTHLQRAAAAPEPPQGPVRPTTENVWERMSTAMRSFILDTNDQTSLSNEKQKGLNSLVKEDNSVQRTFQDENSSAGSPRTSVSDSRYSTDFRELDLAMSYQHRYKFFTDIITFVKSITDVSEVLRHLEPAKRKTELPILLKSIKIPKKVYIPLCRSTDKYCNVQAVFSSFGRVFSTNERAPCLIYFDTAINANGDDVSTSLFDHLYEPEVGNVKIYAKNKEQKTLKDTAHHTTLAPENTFSMLSSFSQKLLQVPLFCERAEKVFGPLSHTIAHRLRPESVVQEPERWRLIGLFAKSFDDLRQEVLVMQLITYFQQIFDRENLPLRLHPYQILSTGASTGLIQIVENSISLDALKKQPDFKNLRCHFETLYQCPQLSSEGSSEFGDNELLNEAQLNFIRSLAAYSLVCYTLCIKDRHNGNILLDVEGHIIHIDFGYGRAPGGTFSFETAPFKLTCEMVNTFGGINSKNFTLFCDLCVKGALALRKHAEAIYTLVDVMSIHSKLPCFSANMNTVLASFRDRLFMSVEEDKVESIILQMIQKSYDHYGTTKYDQFQVYSNGIAR